MEANELLSKLNELISMQNGKNSSISGASSTPQKRKYVKNPSKEHGSSNPRNQLFLKLTSIRERVRKAADAEDQFVDLVSQLADEDKKRFKARIDETQDHIDLLHQKRKPRSKTNLQPDQTLEEYLEDSGSASQLQAVVEGFEKQAKVIVPETPIDKMPISMSTKRKAEDQNEEDDTSRRKSTSQLKQLREQPASLQEVPLTLSPELPEPVLSAESINKQASVRPAGYYTKLTQLLKK